MFIAFKQYLLRDLRLALRKPMDVCMPFIFFILVVCLFPLAVGPEPKILAMIAPGILWVAALLAALLSLHKLFEQDYQDGSLEQLLLTPTPLMITVSAKITAHWLTTGLPLIILSPFVALLFGMHTQVIGILILSLLLGTPLLSLIGAIAAALTVGLKNNGFLLALLVLPLYVPLLIFGASAVMEASLGMVVAGQLALLAALLCFAITLVPITTASALRIGVAL